MKAQRSLGVVLAGLLAALLPVGCGQTSAIPAGPSGTDALKGNWLLTGSLPVSGPSFPLSQQFGLTMTLDVSGGQVLANESHFYPCGTTAAGGAGALPAATIAADGSFTLQTQRLSATVPTVMLSVHGKVPQAGSGNWTGTYTATNANAGCDPVLGTFTAVPIQLVSGTFSGAGTLRPRSGPDVASSSVSIAFVQGGPASLDPPLHGLLVNSVSALSGTIKVTGSSCFASGTATIPSGSVVGDGVDAQFAMDDGSRLLLLGSVTTASAATIKLTSLLVEGGACDGWSGYSQSILTRQ